MNGRTSRSGALTRFVVSMTLAIVAASPSSAGGSRELPNEITLYAGRGESLVAPLIERFERETGLRVNVRYAGTAELAVLLQEEGSRSPADLYWAQDAGALGALARAGLLRSLPTDLFDGTPEIFRNSAGQWVATSGRARVLAYHTGRQGAASLPRSVFDLVAPQYRGRVGWAPTNGSFQSFITALRVLRGEEYTQRWVEAMIANGVQAYRNNTAIIEAIAAGEIDYGLTNNYYLLRYLAEQPNYPVRRSFFAAGDAGNLVNVAGMGILKSARNPAGAERLLRFLLAPAAQQYVVEEIFEYPAVQGVRTEGNMESFERLIEVSPRLDLDALEDLPGTLELLRRAGAL